MNNNINEINDAIKNKEINYDSKQAGKVFSSDGLLICRTSEGDPLSQIAILSQGSNPILFNTLPGKEEYPVIDVTWYGASLFCQSKGYRLPTEAEWEFAAYGGKKDIIHVWGNDKFSEEAPQANIWQGVFPYKSTKLNGYSGTTSVTTFKPNPYGLYDMSGNVWQWCSDLYHAGFYLEGDQKNPKGPLKSFDPEEPYASKYVNRGGSFLCNKSYCKGYRISARQKTPADTSLNHLGFRCALNCSE